MNLYKMIMLVYSSFLYLLSILIFMFSFQPFVFWLSMEINLILFIFLSYQVSLKSSLFQEENMFFYFLIQSLGSFMFLMSMYFKEESSILFDLFFFGSISLKLGIFPFYFWMLVLGGSLSSIMFILILSFQKVPMFILFYNYTSSKVLFFLFFSFISGSMFIFISDNLLEILVFSSVSSSFWIYFIFLQDMLFYLMFFLFYFMSLTLLMKDLKWEQGIYYKILFFIFVSGMPPLSLFFFKFFISYQLMLNNLGLYSLLFWLMSFISLLGYFKFFYSNFFFKKFLYLNKKFCFKKMSFFMGSMLFSVFFLV